MHEVEVYSTHNHVIKRVNEILSFIDAAVSSTNLGSTSELANIDELETQIGTYTTVIIDSIYFYI